MSDAFHSGLMDGVLEELGSVVGGLSLGRPVVPVVSTLTGVMDEGQWSDPGYWVRQVREPVRFLDAVRVAEGWGAGV
ncbi:hypothetical protein, partial [Kitasatospora phosalacinea]|uniref:hypothetical protein n=1 Tax=Kitasatospora phosalacinea TaxID=2065 RepID=UPI00131CEFE2